MGNILGNILCVSHTLSHTLFFGITEYTRITKESRRDDYRGSETLSILLFRLPLIDE